MTRVGITHGDINGISLELIAKALAAPELMEFCTPIVFSDEHCFLESAKSIEIEQNIPFEVIASAKEVIDGRVNLVSVCSDNPKIEWGQQTETALKAEADSLNAAIEAYKEGIIDVLVCAPGQLDNNVDSHPLSDFIQRAVQTDGKVFDWIMADGFRTLKLPPLEFTTELGEGMAKEAFAADVKAINQHLREDFGFIKPRIAVVSGRETLANDLSDLRDNGVIVFGPFVANEFIDAGQQAHYDAVLFLDEEEARHRLIASLNPETTIGYVSGMPIVLTYPLTGVNYSEAGKSLANETPLRNAIYTSIDIARNRRRYHEATRHPLEKQWVAKGRDDFKLDLTKEDA